MRTMCVAQSTFTDIPLYGVKHLMPFIPTPYVVYAIIIDRF
jgi:hypothetical protein